MHMCMAHVYVYCGTDGGDIVVSISLIDTLSPLLLPLSLLILHCHLFVIVISLAPIHASIVTSHSCHSCLYLSYGHMDTLSPLFLPLSTFTPQFTPRLSPLILDILVSISLIDILSHCRLYSCRYLH